MIKHFGIRKDNKYIFAHLQAEKWNIKKYGAWMRSRVCFKISLDGFLDYA